MEFVVYCSLLVLMCVASSAGLSVILDQALRCMIPTERSHGKFS